MWKYLKDCVIGKLLDKWILSGTETSSDSFLHYHNIDLNISSFSNSILNNFALSNGTVEELKVNVDWKEIFRYWTEIRAKYHIEIDEDALSEDDSEEYTDDSAESLISIRGTVLNFSKNINSKSKTDEPVVDNDVNLMRDFLDHIVGQFRIEIEDLTVILSDELVIKVPSVSILPESNGLRRIIVNEDIEIQSDAQGRILKGSEILIMRTVEGTVVKVKVSGTEIEARDLDCLMKISQLFETDKSQRSESSVNFELGVDVLKIALGPLSLVVHDIWLTSTGSFILGHFSIKLKHYSVIVSPVQTHVVTGDYKERKVVVEEEIIVWLKDIQQIDAIKAVFTSGSDSYGSKDTDFIVKLKSVALYLDEALKITVKKATVSSEKISVESVRIGYKSSQVDIHNIKYNIRSKATALPQVSPFAELKRFIENDEIVSIEDESVLYGKFSELIDELEVGSVIGSLNYEDFDELLKLVQSSTNTSTQNSTNALMGTIQTVQVTLNNLIQAQFDQIRFLKTESIIDLRGHLTSLKRNGSTLIREAEIVISKTDEIGVLCVENMKVLVPFDLYDQISEDMKIFNFASDSEPDKMKSGNFQLNFKNSSVKLEAPDEPVESELFVKEVTMISSQDVLYVDEAVLKLCDEEIFNSGLVKINYDTKVIKVMNHCSQMNLTREGYRNLGKFASFWSEIYSPPIEEIQPDPVFRYSAGGEECGGLNGILMQFEDDGIELELDCGVTENSEHDTSNSLSASSDILSDRECEITADMRELLEDIDDEFFIKKQQVESIHEDSKIKFSNFGLKINLILNDQSDETMIISLNHIGGSIGSKIINLKVKEGAIHKNKTKTLLHRWPRGPDVTCKYPIEDGNFFSVKAEKLWIKNDAGIDEYNLTVSVCPLRLFLDQKLLNELAEFTYPEVTERKMTDKLRSFIFFNKVSISPLAVKLDYTPNAVTPIPLQGAEMVLPRVELRGIKGVEGLGPALFSAWIPELKGKNLTGVLKTGLVPVRTLVNLGGGVAELILLPWQLGSEHSAAQTVAQIRKNGKRVGLEALKLTTSLASRTSKLLGSNQGQGQSKSYPKDFQSGVQQAAQLIIALPMRMPKTGGLKAVPLMVLDSAATATGALAKTLQGLQAEFDREVDYERRLKNNK